MLPDGVWENYPVVDHALSFSGKSVSTLPIRFSTHL
jgi:hypothetical protein